MCVCVCVCDRERERERERAMYDQLDQIEMSLFPRIGNGLLFNRCGIPSAYVWQYTDDLTFSDPKYVSARVLHNSVLPTPCIIHGFMFDEKSAFKNK